MPRFRGSCGCYNRQDARELGLAPAIVWNDMIDRAEHFDMNPMWYDQKDAGERLGIPERSMNRAVDKLVEAGRISKKKGYRPGTTTSTTWVTILEESVGGSRNDDLAVPRSDDLAVPILKETKERDYTAVTPVVVFLRVNPSGKAWKSQRVYSTQEEVDRLEESDPDDTIDFKYWKSPKMVGDDARAKFKRTKAKLIQPDVQEEPDEINQIEGLENYMKFGDM